MHPGLDKAHDARPSPERLPSPRTATGSPPAPYPTPPQHHSTSAPVPELLTVLSNLRTALMSEGAQCRRGSVSPSARRGCDPDNREIRITSIKHLVKGCQCKLISASLILSLCTLPTSHFSQVLDFGFTAGDDIDGPIPPLVPFIKPSDYARFKFVLNLVGPP